MAQTSNADVVRAFYDAIASGDGATLAALVPERFAPDVTFVWPGSLPYGGEVSGAERIAKTFAAMLASPVPVGPKDLKVVNVIDGGDTVVAEVTFGWQAPGSEESIESGALERWSFDGPLVTECRAYYWDTAACRELIQSTQASA